MRLRCICFEWRMIDDICQKSREKFLGRRLTHFTSADKSIFVLDVFLEILQKYTILFNTLIEKLLWWQIDGATKKIFMWFLESTNQDNPLRQYITMDETRIHHHILRVKSAVKWMEKMAKNTTVNRKGYGIQIMRCAWNFFYQLPWKEN